MAKDSVSLHWDYLAFLDRDLEVISETVELCQDNYGAYGPRILQLVLNSGDELSAALETLLKMIAPELVDKRAGKLNIRDFKRFISSNLNGEMSSAEAVYLHTDIPPITPWKQVCQDPETKPSWWETYNNAKHHRGTHYRDANLESALTIVAALFVVDCQLVDLKSPKMKDALALKPLTMIDRPMQFSAAASMDVPYK